MVDPSDYTTLLEQLKGGAPAADQLAFRKRCAWKAFQHCATYDSTVAEWLWGAVGEGPAPEMSVPMKLAQVGGSACQWAVGWRCVVPCLNVLLTG